MGDSFNSKGWFVKKGMKVLASGMLASLFSVNAVSARGLPGLPGEAIPMGPGQMWCTDPDTLARLFDQKAEFKKHVRSGDCGYFERDTQVGVLLNTCKPLPSTGADDLRRACMAITYFAPSKRAVLIEFSHN